MEHICENCLWYIEKCFHLKNKPVKKEPLDTCIDWEGLNED